MTKVKSSTPVWVFLRPTPVDQPIGEILWVQIDLEKDDHDHLIPPEERFKVAMARQ